MTKPRKGQEYTPLLLDVLLRDAKPTRREIANEPSPRKRRENERARDLATDKLLSIYSEHEKQGTSRELDARVRNFCEELKRRNAGVLPKKKGGRPIDAHRRLLIAIEVKEALAAQKGKRKNVTFAIREVSDRNGLAATTVRDIYYRRDPEWQRAIKIGLI